MRQISQMEWEYYADRGHRVSIFLFILTGLNQTADRKRGAIFEANILTGEGTAASILVPTGRSVGFYQFTRNNH
jgi:hypothetical protein